MKLSGETERKKYRILGFSFTTSISEKDKLKKKKLANEKLTLDQVG